MASNIRMTLKIAGKDLKRKEGDKELGFIECQTCSSGVGAPFAMVQGEGPKASGLRHHDMIQITKQVDSTTPLLMKAVCLGEKIDEGTFDFYRQGKSGGSSEVFFTLKMKDAYIADLTQADGQLETVKFVFTSITWSAGDKGSISHTDVTNATEQK